jgi:hypothetical protein
MPINISTNRRARKPSVGRRVRYVGTVHRRGARTLTRVFRIITVEAA